MAVGIKNIAEKTGFSEATVSLALNGSKLVNIKTKEKILQTAKQMGYIPNNAARNLARKNNFSLGLIVPDIENVFYASLVKHINEEAKRRGYSLMIAISQNSAENEKKIIEDMIQNRISGLIIVPMNVPNEKPDYIKSLEDYHIMYVFCSDYYTHLESDAPVVMSNLKDGMYKITKMVTSRGYKKIAFLTGSDDVASIKLRLEGFKLAAKQSGADAKVFALDDVGYGSACEKTKQIMRDFADTEVFVCVNDMVALGVINTLASMGLSVPKDKGVTGFDNIIFSKVAFTQITTVSQDIKQIAKKSVEQLINMTEGKEGKNVFIDTKIEVRNSLL